MEYNGGGRGWFEVPGRPSDWCPVMDRIAQETGVYLYAVEPLEAVEHKAATSGVLPGEMGPGEVYLSDYIEESF
jgi:hypothetical protein